MDLFDTLLQAKEAYRTSRDLVGKVTGIAIAPVYQVYPDDTITVLLPESGGRSPSPRLYRALPGRGLTYPAMSPGDTVAYGFIEGNANKGIYWGILHNALNPPSDLSNYSYQLGNTNSVITSTSVSHYVEDLEEPGNPSGIVITEEGVKVEKKGTVGASLTVLDGVVTIQTGTTTFVFSQGGLSVSASGGSGGSFTLSGVDSASINGFQITTLGAVDTDGDTLVNKGW